MPQTFANAYALLIAVNEHRSPGAALPEIAQDVDAIQAVLIHPDRCGYAPENVKLIKGPDSTKDDILDGLDWLKTRLDADNSGNATVVIYYTGHGHLEGGEYFLIPFDTNLGRIRSSALRAADFAAEVLALKPQRLLVMLDCCHAAGMDVKGLDRIIDVAIPPTLFAGGAIGAQGGKRLDDLAKGSGRAILSSSKVSEKSWIRKDRKMSIFTWHVIEALTGHAEPKAGAREVLVSDVMGHVHRRVPESVRADWNADQHPDSFVSGNFPVSLLLGGNGLAQGAKAPSPASVVPIAQLTKYEATATNGSAVAQGYRAVAVAAGGTYNHYDGAPPNNDAEGRRIYLNVLSRMVSRLPLRAFDARHSNPNTKGGDEPRLSGVYTSLDTKNLVRELRPLRHGAMVDPKVPTPFGVITRAQSALIAADAYRCLVLLGEPGSGKSTFGNHLIYCLAQTEAGAQDAWVKDFQRDWTLPAGAVLPVRVILRDFDAWLDDARMKQPAVPKALTDFIAHMLAPSNLSFAAPLIVTALEAGTALIIMDGLDEVTTIKKRVYVRDAIAALASRYGASRFLVTCRTRSYLAPEPDSADEDLRIPNFPEFELAPFDTAKINAFIDAWYGELQRAGLESEKAESLRAKLHVAVRKRDLRRLAANPLQLTLMAWVNTFETVLPDKRAKLYQKAVDLLLWKWETEKPGGARTLRDLASDIEDGENKIRRVLCREAFGAHARMTTKRTNKDEEVEEALADVNEDALRVAISNLKKDGEGQGDLNWSRDVVNALKLRSGLLAQRLPGVLTLPHRTFQEYLAAQHLLGSSDFVKEALALTDRLDLWREVILLAIGHSVFVKEDDDLARPLLLAQALCPTRADNTEVGWIRASLAGDILGEAGPDRVDEKGMETAQRVRRRLLGQLTGNQRTAIARARAGDSLARLGDPRFDRQFYNLPSDPLRGFIHVLADPGFMIGTRKKDKERVEEILQWEGPHDYINDTRTPTSVFFISRFPVIVAQWRAYVESMRELEPGFTIANDDSLADPDTRPVRYLNWREAMAYCAWLDKKLRNSGFFGRSEFAGKSWHVTLPSELEWEKAARGGTTTVYPWGDTPDREKSNDRDARIRNTSPVGTFPPNELGCFDMTGNVWECTRSIYAEYPYNPRDGRESLKIRQGNVLVMRGGSWDLPQTFAHCTCRNWTGPDDRCSYMGFRVVVAPVRPLAAR